MIGPSRENKTKILMEVKIMYYSAGTYESFVRPEKPKDVDKKSAYIIGTGLAGLSAAFYLVRDGQMKGEHIHLLEKLELAGGSCDGYRDVTKGFFMRGGREMDNHFEVMWDVFRDVPSLEHPGQSVLDEYYYLNKIDPNYSLCRATVRCGEDAHTDKKFTLDRDSALALSQLFITPEEQLEDKKISDVLPESFWETNFWLYWQTMFAFQRWSSALEMKRYLCRYVHHIDGLPDFSALRFTKYNQYESMILPLVKYLESHGVKIEYGFDVKNVVIENVDGKRVARRIEYVKDGTAQSIDLVEDDLVFITNGCCTDTSCYGDQTHAPDLSGVKNGCGESWDMWKAIAAQATHGEYGNPDAFCSDVEATNWMSATVATANEEIIQHIMRICKRDPRAGKVTTGGIVTVRDSSENWYLSWTINRQPQFKSQDPNTVLVLYQRLFPAAQELRPPAHRPRRRRELRLPRPVRRDPARHDLHDRVFHAHRYGERLHPAERRPRRPRSLGQQIRRPRAAARLLLCHRQTSCHGYQADLQGEGDAEGGPEENQGHRHRAPAPRERTDRVIRIRKESPAKAGLSSACQKASQSSPAHRRKKSNPFSEAACTSPKILIGSQTCACAPKAHKSCAAASRSLFKREPGEAGPV